MTAITAARTPFRTRTGPAPRSAACTVTLAIATPVLALALSWGLVDACAFTQHSLQGFYAVSATPA